MNRWFFMWLLVVSACSVSESREETARQVEVERARYEAMQERLMLLAPGTPNARLLADSIAANTQFQQDAVGAIQHYRHSERLLESIFGKPVVGNVYRLQGSSTDRWSKERMRELSDSLRLASGIWWDRTDILGKGTDFHADTLGIEVFLKLREVDISVESLTDYVIQYSMEATLRPPEGVDSLQACYEKGDFSPCALSTPGIFRRVFSTESER